MSKWREVREGVSTTKAKRGKKAVWFIPTLTYRTHNAAPVSFLWFHSVAVRRAHWCTSAPLALLAGYVALNIDPSVCIMGASSDCHR